MSEKMREFIEKLAKDEGLLKKMEGAKSPEEAFAIASEAVNGLDQKDFTETMLKLKEMAEKKQQQGTAELSDEDLDMVAGGLSFEEENAIIHLVFYGLAALAAI